MPRPARPWFRVYVEMFPDRKIRRLTPAQRWIWVSLLGAARESPHSPSLFVAETVPMTYQEIADYAAVKEREIGPALAAMTKLGMVQIEDGIVTIPNFAGRQYESDDVTKRTRAHRERSDRDTVSGSLERSNVVPRNTPETETEAETELTDLVEPAALKPKDLKSTKDPRFVEFWSVYPKRVAPESALKSLAKILNDGTELQDVVKGAARYRDDPKRTAEFTAHPATWLRAGRWQDEAVVTPNGTARRSAGWEFGMD